MVDIEKRLEMIENTLFGGIAVGSGYDSHRFDSSKKGIILGGVRIPFDKGFASHSDGDVLFHSLTDAICGVCAIGDIGTHFPDTDQRYKDMDSSILLKRIMDIAVSKGCHISNIDITVIAERPKLGSYRDEIVKNISAVCGVPAGRISIKAKTNEKMGFIGREEGIAVISAVCAVFKGI